MVLSGALATGVWSQSPVETVVPGGPAQTRIAVEIKPRQATVGDPLEATLTLTLPRGVRLAPRPLGPELGPFTVTQGGWQPPVASGEAVRWTWRGRLVAFETGVLQLPPVVLDLEGPGGRGRASSDPASVTIRSVLDPAELEEGSAPQIAGLKPPAGLPADHGPLRKALLILLALAALAGLLAWLHRRYARHLAAAPLPDNPFARMPPHVWAYEALGHLLERRLAEEGRVDVFYDELSHIVKRYLGGRYRLELLERTTSEAEPLLGLAGAPPEAVRSACALLEAADRVRFAREASDPIRCRAAVEEAYRLVDATRPADAPQAGAQGRRGAA